MRSEEGVIKLHQENFEVGAGIEDSVWNSHRQAFLAGYKMAEADALPALIASKNETIRVFERIQRAQEALVERDGGQHGTGSL